MEMRSWRTRDLRRLDKRRKLTRFKLASISQIKSAVPSGETTNKTRWQMTLDEEEEELDSFSCSCFYFAWAEINMRLVNLLKCRNVVLRCLSVFCEQIFAQIYMRFLSKMTSSFVRRNTFICLFDQEKEQHHHRSFGKKNKCVRKWKRWNNIRIESLLIRLVLTNPCLFASLLVSLIFSNEITWRFSWSSVNGPSGWRKSLVEEGGSAFPACCQEDLW